MCIFVDRELRGPQVRQRRAVSRTKVAHTLRITHRDEVEPPISGWLAEAYALQDAPR